MYLGSNRLISGGGGERLPQKQIFFHDFHIMEGNFFNNINQWKSIKETLKKLFAKNQTPRPPLKNKWQLLWFSVFEADNYVRLVMIIINLQVCI